MKYLLILGAFFVFCGCSDSGDTTITPQYTEEGIVDKLIINQEEIDVYEDQYGNRYMKEYTYARIIYIPLPKEFYEDYEEETPDAESYEVKTVEYDTSKSNLIGRLRKSTPDGQDVPR